jgi:hypothetical protein
MGRSDICLEVDDDLRVCRVLDLVGLKAEAEAKKVKRVAVVNFIVIVWLCWVGEGEGEGCCKVLLIGNYEKNRVIVVLSGGPQCFFLTWQGALVSFFIESTRNIITVFLVIKSYLS